MNKYTFAEIKVGDYFLHMEDKGVYKLLDIKEDFRGDMTYKFLEIKTNQEWIHTKKWFTKKLMPAPRAIRILYGA